MKNKTILYFLIILSSLMFVSCNKESDVTALHNRIDMLVNLIEEHKESKLSNYFTKDFVTSKNLNQAQFLLFARYHFKRNKSISIIIVDKTVITTNDFFDVKFRVLLLGSNSLFPERGEMYNVFSRWNKEGGKWRISRIRWERASATE